LFVGCTAEYNAVITFLANGENYITFIMGRKIEMYGCLEATIATELHFIPVDNEQEIKRIYD
jgi:hypothetical protein